MATERDVLSHIDELIAEEHSLRSGEPSDADRRRLASLEEQLDQAWDMLRRRRAAKHSGTDPDAVHERPAGEVESYLQ